MRLAGPHLRPTASLQADLVKDSDASPCSRPEYAKELIKSAVIAPPEVGIVFSLKQRWYPTILMQDGQHHYSSGAKLSNQARVQFFVYPWRPNGFRRQNNAEVGV